MADLARHPVAARIEAPGLVVTTRAPAGQWLVTGTDMEPNTRAGTDPYALWLAPGRRLVVADTPAPAPDDTFVSDVTDGLVLIEIIGSRSMDLLAMGCPLDPLSLPQGACAQTLFAGIRVVLYRHGAAVRMHVERPLASWLLDWFRQAATSLR
ncbi:aminomethyltransferase family protein [Limobrevibacterium gyesilva]|uniref:Sarcosine oxidase subunit gamma n=1 Tax=Limobrevibacterium gyesilva TaxID=2991712 RepID=A0AA42CH10_9PROT|nr:hypothetical protein [Limobrevibacterium gyesilva]MCW3474380.1 hypothetical protein [Limobrevibacterium gyesilva]